jgi:hypothetical protein
MAVLSMKNRAFMGMADSEKSRMPAGYPAIFPYFEFFYYQPFR